MKKKDMHLVVSYRFRGRGGWYSNKHSVRGHGKKETLAFVEELLTDMAGKPEVAEIRIRRTFDKS